MDGIFAIIGFFTMITILAIVLAVIQILYIRTKQKMVVIEYTNEMKEQDRLWKLQKTDTNRMQELFIEIIKKFNRKGLQFEYELNIQENEAVINITYKNGDVHSFRDCESLIEYLTSLAKKSK